MVRYKNRNLLLQIRTPDKKYCGVYLTPNTLREAILKALRYFLPTKNKQLNRNKSQKCSRDELECCGGKFKSEVRQLLDEFSSDYSPYARTCQSQMCAAFCDGTRTRQ